MSPTNQATMQGDGEWKWPEKTAFVLAITFWGGLGSILDSALGGWFQASVIDTRTGKVIEGSGGKKVLVAGSRIPANKASDKPSRRIESGLGVLDNNEVNLLMALLMSIGGMIAASFVWGIPLQSISSW
ncbi:hypothetical protein ACLMJK_003412 [Lecanora helva]